ncbi:MAG: response regulator [Desulfobacteraceae bacterium]|jgi:DNA-binding NtrC family response regulator
MQPKILIVDDQPLVLGVFREILARGPYHVLAVESAEKALQLLEDESVDVVISDERMPGMQGSEFLTIVRNKYPEVVRIILTGHASVESAMRAINESEIFRFLTKPVNSTVLHKAVEDALASRAKGRDTEQHYSILENLEKQAPGITHVRRDNNGVVIIDEDDE